MISRAKSRRSPRWRPSRQGSLFARLIMSQIQREGRKSDADHRQPAEIEGRRKKRRNQGQTPDSFVPLIISSGGVAEQSGCGKERRSATCNEQGTFRAGECLTDKPREPTEAKASIASSSRYCTYKSGQCKALSR